LQVQKGSAIHHGETNALENAGRQPAHVYKESVLYTTLSPCSMCTGAILLYGFKKVRPGKIECSFVLIQRALEINQHTT
jgi:cytosine deaminase